MAQHKIVMPQMGESITNGTITKWHKNEGDLIKNDEIILEISTDKVESEIPSPFEGRLERILFQEGETVDVGIEIATIEDDLNVKFSKSMDNKIEDKVVSSKSVEMQNSLGENDERRAFKFYTPLVKSMAKAHSIDLGDLKEVIGSGINGRVTKKDFENFLNKSSDKKNETQGFVKKEDPSPVKFEFTGSEEIIEMDNMRKVIAKNMVASKLTSPHVNSISEVDVSSLVKFRESIKDNFFRDEGFKITYTPFILKAIIDAIKVFPIVNSSVNGDQIIIKKDINIGCAVAVPGNGLVVPIIKNADKLSLTGIAHMLDSLARKARNKKLSMSDLSGGTYTFTNVGSFGTLLATPIILQPQVAIYASGAIKRRVMAMKDDSIAIRSMMYGTHTYDHRIIDGEIGGLFLEQIHSNLSTMDFNKLM